MRLSEFWALMEQEFGPGYAGVVARTQSLGSIQGRTPLERGRFLHELFETFFHEWQARGRGRITSREMADARALFEEVAEPALRSLLPAEAALERARLFGSAVGSGIADRVFAMEAERGYGPRVRAVVDQSHETMGELQKETLSHMFAMRAVLTPEQARKFDRAVTKALTADQK